MAETEYEVLIHAQRQRAIAVAIGKLEESKTNVATNFLSANAWVYLAYCNKSQETKSAYTDAKKNARDIAAGCFRDAMGIDALLNRPRKDLSSMVVELLTSSKTFLDTCTVVSSGETGADMIVAMRETPDSNPIYIALAIENTNDRIKLKRQAAKIRDNMSRMVLTPCIIWAFGVSGSQITDSVRVSK